MVWLHVVLLNSANESQEIVKLKTGSTHGVNWKAVLIYKTEDFWFYSQSFERKQSEKNFDYKINFSCQIAN